MSILERTSTPLAVALLPNGSVARRNYDEDNFDMHLLFLIHWGRVTYIYMRQ